MNLQPDFSFEADYDVEAPIDMPSVIDYEIHRSGMMPRADLVLKVTTGDGRSWTGGVRAGEPSVGFPRTGVHATPNRKRLLVVARGDAYLIDVDNPAGYEALTTGPVVAVKSIPKEHILLLATPWNVTGIREGGATWITERMAIDGLRLDESQEGRVAGVADPRDVEPRDFVIDLATGRHEGGVRFT